MKESYNFMLVDDDANTNFYNEHIIKQAIPNAWVIAFKNGREAIEYLQESTHQVDVILLDINMPIMNGWEFLEAYSSLDKAKKAKILIMMLTSSINPEEREKAERLGLISKFINKPLTIEKINQIIEQIS